MRRESFAHGHEGRLGQTSPQHIHIRHHILLIKHSAHAPSAGDNSGTPPSNQSGRAAQGSLLRGPKSVCSTGCSGTPQTRYNPLTSSTTTLLHNPPPQPSTITLHHNPPRPPSTTALHNPLPQPQVRPSQAGRHHHPPWAPTGVRGAAGQQSHQVSQGFPLILNKKKFWFGNIRKYSEIFGTVKKHFSVRLACLLASPITLLPLL